MNTRTKAGRTNRARAVKVLTPTELFFFDNAGYSYNPKKETAQQGRIQCAKDLAFAELTAERMQWSYSWIWDTDPDLSWMSEEERSQEHETFVCILNDADGNWLESLGGITDPSNDYRRVIEAELAAEALAHLNAMRISGFVDPITA